MKEFKDNDGTRWYLSLTVSSAARVRDLVRVTPASGTEKAFDIIDAATVAETFQVLRSNYSVIGETLYAILLPEVEKRGLTKDQFLDKLSGDSLDSGARAIEEEIVDFFPPRLRGMVNALLTKLRELTEAVVSKAEAEVMAMELPGTSSGSVPASSDATPESGPSGG